MTAQHLILILTSSRYFHVPQGWVDLSPCCGRGSQPPSGETNGHTPAMSPLRTPCRPPHHNQGHVTQHILVPLRVLGQYNSRVNAVARNQLLYARHLGLMSSLSVDSVRIPKRSGSNSATSGNSPACMCLTNLNGTGGSPVSMERVAVASTGSVDILSSIVGR